MEEEEKPTILYIDDEEDNLVVFKAAFRRDYKIFTALSADEGMEILKNNSIPIIITDQRMPSMTGIQFLQSLPDEPETIRMILTGFSDIEAVIEAINTGKVYRYITKPWNKDELKITLDKAYETFNLRHRNRILIEELQTANETLEEKVADRTETINKQKVEIEDLLLNILPSEIADELKKFGKSAPRKYENATVMFADIHNFTKIGETLTPELLVDELDRCFRAFDDIIEKYEIEKIKTVGDAYLCVGGLPTADSAHPEKVINAALEMQHYMESYRKEKEKTGGIGFSIRIGVHSGPVVAGVVGAKKFAYDIWGDTVNTAARMESSCEVNKINISSSTYEFIKNKFICTYRGKIEAKNKGEIDMYYVESQIG